MKKTPPHARCGGFSLSNLHSPLRTEFNDCANVRDCAANFRIHSRRPKPPARQRLTAESQRGRLQKRSIFQLRVVLGVRAWAWWLNKQQTPRPKARDLGPSLEGCSSCAVRFLAY